MITLILPYPVSANRYWRHITIKNRAMTILSDEAKAFKEHVGWIARAAGVKTPIIGRVELTIRLYPPRPKDADMRIRKYGSSWDNTVKCLDLDNSLKVTIDALKGIAYADDDQIWSIRANRMEPDEDGKTEIEIIPIIIDGSEVSAAATDSRDSFCNGKEKFESLELAQRVADRKKRGRTYAVYHCTFCGQWHLGNPSKHNRNMRIRFKKKLEDEGGRDG